MCIFQAFVFSVSNFPPAGSFAQEVKVEGSEKVDYAGFAQILWLRSDWGGTIEVFLLQLLSRFHFLKQKEYALGNEYMLWIVVSIDSLSIDLNKAQYKTRQAKTF